MSKGTFNKASSDKKVFERVSYLELALENYGAQIRALNDVVSQIQISINSFSGQSNDINRQLTELQSAVNELTLNTNSAQEEQPKNNTLVYQDSLNKDRQAALLKVNIRPSEKTNDELFAQVNSDVYTQMQCANGLNSGSLADSLDEYRRILTQIVAENPELQFVTAHKLSQTEKDGKTSYCQIRHDVDADIVACLPMAKIEAELGIRSTYFLLHTAAYFGSWEIDEENDEATYRRNESLANYYLEIQKLGHEIAIHTDSLHLYQNLNVDGAEALCADIEWLRSQGIEIAGTAPHNSPEEYGASNSAIFTNRPVTFLKKPGSAGVVKNGKWAPLALLDESELGLVYEADDINSPNHGMNVDYLSPISKDKWWRVIKTPELMEWEQVRDDRYSHYSKLDFWIYEMPDIYTSEDDFWHTSKSLPNTISQRAPKIIVLSVHPEHFGYRKNEQAFPD